MKTRIITTMLILVVILTAFFIYNWRRNNVEQWNEQACIAFKAALKEDLYSRNDLKVVCYGNPKTISSLDAETPKSVFVTSKLGKKEYIIDSCKDANNIMSVPDMRSVAGFTLEKYPLLPDTVNAIWQRFLQKEQIVGDTKVRISVTDLANRTTTKASATLGSLAVCDSLLSCYIGYRCETEVTGFIKYAWLENISVMEVIYFSIISSTMIAFCFLGFIYRKKIECYFVKKVPVIMIKEVPIIAAEYDSPVFKLMPECYFYVKGSLLKTDKGEIKFPPQSALLLRTFLEAKDYRLSSAEILSVLWPNGTSNLNNVHQSVARLRKIVEGVPYIDLINDGYSYYLKISHFIEENHES